MDTMKQQSTDNAVAEDKVLTADEVIGMMVHFHELALELLALNGYVSEKIFLDQAEYVQKMIELLEEDLGTYSPDRVIDALPGNEWIHEYLRAIPLMEAHYAEDEENVSSSRSQ